EHQNPRSLGSGSGERGGGGELGGGGRGAGRGRATLARGGGWATALALAGARATLADDALALGSGAWLGCSGRSSGALAEPSPLGTAPSRSAGGSAALVGDADSTKATTAANPMAKPSSAIATAKRTRGRGRALGAPGAAGSEPIPGLDG